jgi:hypothetical protein
MSEQEQEQLYAITSTGQMTYDSLKIGAGNFWDEEYPGPDGEPINGLICHLWFFLRDHPELDRMARVYPGAVEEIAGYRIEVKSVQRGTPNDFVVLTLDAPG